jgi:hypothetical protein
MPCNVLGDHRGEREVRLPHLRPHHVEVQLRPGREVFVERYDSASRSGGRCPPP